VRATLAMMANWDLRPLAGGSADVDVPVALATGDRDEWTPAAALAPLVAACRAATLTWCRAPATCCTRRCPRSRPLRARRGRARRRRAGGSGRARAGRARGDVRRGPPSE
jgi:hypothetical protein